MKYSIELLHADVEDELNKIGRIEHEWQSAQERIDRPGENVSNYDRGAIGYLLHNFYNGCENIFRSIARFFENDLAVDGWHRDLLKRMRLAIPGFRPPVIDEELFVLLDDFRAFRHRFRHSYAFELDWELERVVALRLPKAAALLRKQLRGFFAELATIEPGGSRDVD